MARNIFSIVKSLVIVVVSVFALAACTAEGADYSTYKAKEDIVRGTKYTNTLVHNLDSTKSSARDNMVATCTIETVENGNVVEGSAHKETANPLMECSIFVTKDDYTITEDQINCSAISTNILRNQTSKSVANNGTEASDTVVVTISDGQIVKCPSTITSYKTTDGHAFGTVELSNAKLVSIENTNISAGTRAATYVKTTLRTMYKMALTYVEKNVEGTPASYTVYLTAAATRRVIADNAIASVTVENKNREVIDDNTEKVSFEEVITMTDGEVVRNAKSMILNREFKGIAAYEKFVSNFAFNLANVNGIANGTEAQVSNAEGWTVYGKTDSYSANISNGAAADAFATAYTLYHERANYKDANVEVSFEYVDVNVNEAKNEVSNVNSDKSGYDKAIYDNAIRTSYMGYTQNIAEQVYLYKTARAISGYDYRDAQLVVNDNNVIASVVFVTRYNDGTEETEKVSKTFARSLTCTSNWTAFENNSDQFTHMLNVKLAGQDKKNDGEWAWVNETRTITNIASLASSEQTNSWTSVDPNSITFSRQGQTYTFGEIEFKAVDEEGKVTLSSDEDEKSVFDYSAKVNVTFGSNTISSVAPGKIIVAKEIKGDFPAEWGKFVSAVCTVSHNETKTDWVYAWSLHFENGTLPVIVGKDAANATVDQSLFDTDTNTRFNGAGYKNGKWQNAIAQDNDHYMLWTNTNGSALNTMLYPTATMWNWNNGHNTVFTSDFTFSIENNGKTLKVMKNGQEFASYRASSK